MCLAGSWSGGSHFDVDIIAIAQILEVFDFCELGFS